MKFEKYKNSFLNISSILIIILMGYAAVVKGSDISLFQKQITESPLIPFSLTKIVSYLIPASELFAALLLMTQITRYWGFLFSYFLMLIFSVYLVTLVNLFGSNLPCACGGILGQMGYNTHIVFNIFFTLLTLASVVLSSYDMDTFFFKKRLILNT